jgi:hypothetical protein
MSPGIARAKSASIQRPQYVIRLQTVWRLYGDGMETHRFSVPADGDQDDLITLEGWTPTHGSLTLNPATALVLDGLQILHVSGPQLATALSRGDAFPQVKPSYGISAVAVLIANSTARPECQVPDLQSQA